ncbi:hypothetical protein Goshw_000937, partial [Gossypium schwendimanii]|nr:hypothetical protein [Gossypium schwendimanii]
MGDNLCRNFPFPAPSLHPQACVPELTQTNLDFSDSGVTIESFRDPTPIAQLDDWLEPSRIILQLFGVPEDWMGQTMVWTNEKHNTYLDSLEASFVKQLHYSKSLHGCHPQVGMREPCLFPQLLAGHNSSHQFSILQDGCGQKINYESNDPLLESTADSGAVLGSPWLHHFRSAGKCSSITFPVPRKIAVPNDEICSRSNTNFYCKSAVNSKHNPIVNSCNHSLDCCTADKHLLLVYFDGNISRMSLLDYVTDLMNGMDEVLLWLGGTCDIEGWAALHSILTDSNWGDAMYQASDQNFVAEDHGEKTSYASGAKRMKMMTVLDASSDSQVAPVGNLHTIDDSIISNISAKRGKKKLLSDHPERLTCPKTQQQELISGDRLSNGYTTWWARHCDCVH